MGLIKAYNGDMPYIFISYSHKDSDIVMQMVSQMQADGYRVWYDDGIKPGTEWDEFIASRINGSCYFLAFLSENYLNSSNCKDEMNYARDHVENILLVYLEAVTLPSGMELRFGRNQAIFAYNYADKDEFFNKLYLSKDINLCMGLDASEVVEEASQSVPTENRVENILSNETKPKSKKKLFIILAAIAVLITAVVVVGIIVVTNSSTSKKSKSDRKTKTERDVDDDSDEDSNDEDSEDKEDVYQSKYSSYDLTVGEVNYFMNDMDFYDCTGAADFYDIDKDEYVDGVFTDTSVMFMMIPVLSEYNDPIHVQWYYAVNDENEMLVADYSDIYPSSDEGIFWYEVYLTEDDVGGEFEEGEYYIAIYTGDNVEESIIAKVEYKSS